MAIALLGKIGSGKTTLYNKITLSQENVKAGGASVTLNVFMKKSCFGQGFSVLDTPGFGSESKKIDHVAGVISALSEGPINRIVFIVRFHRTNTIIDDVKTILPAFMNYRDMITVIVTCWDFCEKAEEETNKKDIQQRLAKFKINSVMFVGKNTTSEDICSQIDQIIAQSQAQNIALKSDEIFKSFDLAEYDEGEVFEIELLKAELIEDYRKFSSQAIKYIKDNSISKGLQTDFFYALTQFAKSLVDETLSKFENQKIIDQLGSTEQLKAFQIHFQLKSTLFNEYEQIVDAANQRLHNGNHFSKFIRKCYHCGQIWFKSAGCNGQTICGRLNNNHLDDFIKQEDPPQRCKITYKNEILKFEFFKLDQRQISEQEKKQNLMTDETKIKIEEMTLGSEKFQVGGAGCKRIIDWSKMYPLTEEEMNIIQGILDLKFCKDMIELEKLTQEKTLKLQLQYEKDLQQKIQEQSKSIKKVS